MPLSYELKDGALLRAGPDASTRSLLTRCMLGFVVLGVACLIMGALGQSYYGLPFDFDPRLVTFWESRFSVFTLAGMLYRSCAILFGCALLFFLLQQEGFLRFFARFPGLLAQHRRTLTIAVAMTGVLLAIGYTALRFAHNTEYEAAALADLARGEAFAPFQYRALIPFLAGWLHGVSGLPLHTFYVAFEGMAAVGLFFAFRRYLGGFFADRLTAGLLALSLFYALYFTFASVLRVNAFYYPYDTAALLFFTLGLVALHERRWGLFYLVFLLGTFNRETTCFLTFVFVFTAWGRVPLRTILAHGAAQLVLWLAIKTLLVHVFHAATVASGDDAVFADQLTRNLDFLSRPLSYFYLAQVMGGCWMVVLCLQKYLRDAFTRRALLVSLPFFAGMMVVGLLPEIRVFGELIPLFLAAFWLIMREVVRTLRPAPTPAVHDENYSLAG